MPIIHANIAMAGPLNADDPAALWRLVQQSPAQGAHWFDLACSYANDHLAWQAGYAARQALRCDAALGPKLKTLDLGAWQDSADGDALLGRPALPHAAILEKQFAARVADCPGDWLTWLYLARLRELIALQEADPRIAAIPPAAQEAALEQAQRLEPIPGESLHWMGVWRLNAGDEQSAIAALSRLLDIRPLRCGSMMYLGEALIRTGNTAAAEKAFARASSSDNPDFLLTLSTRVYGHNYWQEAIAVLRKALMVRPGGVALWLALAKIQSEVYFLSDCEASLRQVQALDPDNADARLLEAGLRGRMGDANGHFAALQAAYDARGDALSRLASSLAMTSLYHDALSANEVAELHRRVCAPIEAAVTRQGRGTFSAAARSRKRQLRIGYVTGDFHRQHPVSLFMLPLLLRHDHARMAVNVYHTGILHDDYTRLARANSDRWLESATLDDGALRQAIAADGIDILVDLAGHTASHRLGVFAMRAAPVQATFLGYPHSTGLSAIDWLIGDANVSPPEHGHLYSERLALLPHSVFCWAPVDTYALPAPRPATAPVVFGSFNNAIKLSPRTVALWARVLHAVPDSRLLLKAPSFRDDSVKARFAGLFASQGIGTDRLIFRGPSGLAQMMLEYGDMDIALDPTPYNGGTTSLQALWMGVPLVTLAGSNFASRMGASFLHTLGKHDWVAQDENTYVATASRLARNCAAYRKNRARLRDKFAGSPLSDIQTYTRHFESLLWRMWQAHCETDDRRVLRIAPDPRLKLV